MGDFDAHWTALLMQDVTGASDTSARTEKPTAAVSARSILHRRVGE